MNKEQLEFKVYRNLPPTRHAAPSSCASHSRPAFPIHRSRTASDADDSRIDPVRPHDNMHVNSASLLWNLTKELWKKNGPKAPQATNHPKSDLWQRSYERKTLQKHPWHNPSQKVIFEKGVMKGKRSKSTPGHKPSKKWSLRKGLWKKKGPKTPLVTNHPKSYLWERGPPRSKYSVKIVLFSQSH